MLTIDSSVMTISVYGDDDAADRASDLLEQDISKWQLRDVTLLRGTLDLMHIETSHQEHNRAGQKQEETRPAL